MKQMLCPRWRLRLAFFFSCQWGLLRLVLNSPLKNFANPIFLQDLNTASAKDPLYFEIVFQILKVEFSNRKVHKNPFVCLISSKVLNSILKCAANQAMPQERAFILAEISWKVYKSTPPIAKMICVKNLRALGLNGFISNEFNNDY